MLNLDLNCSPPEEDEPGPQASTPPAREEVDMELQEDIDMELQEEVDMELQEEEAVHGHAAGTPASHSS